MKKILSFLMSLFLVLTTVSGSVFALDESGEIDAAMKAIRKNEKTIVLMNDMTPDEFLGIVKKVIPEGSTVELSFSKESDYRLYNATSEKSGSVFANIQFTCGPYVRHEMYSIEIPMLTGAAAENNADRENLAKDKAAANEIFKGVSLAPDVTGEDILNSIRAVITHGSTVALDGEITKVESTATKKGSVKCSVKFTLNNETDILKVNNTLRLLEDESKTEDNKNTTPAEPENKSAASVNFADVADGAYYAAAVKWAVGKSITQGTSSTTFSPDDTCTRAQILTFLWRAVGSPKAEAANPFSDVKSSDYYYDAAVWASQKGMVAGDKFEGNTPCTRASTVMYLWKNADSPVSVYGDYRSFDDVSEDADYYDAVSWAVAMDVTSGVSDTEFAPDEICSRGQIVTFLNRALED